MAGVIHRQQLAVFSPEYECLFLEVKCIAVVCANLACLRQVLSFLLSKVELRAHEWHRHF